MKIICTATNGVYTHKQTYNIHIFIYIKLNYNKLLLLYMYKIFIYACTRDEKVNFYTNK